MLANRIDKYEVFDGAYRVDSETITLMLNKLPYNLTNDNAIRLKEELDEILIETIVYSDE